MEISAPITYNEEVIGVISAISYTYVQKAILSDNIEKVKQSLIVFCDLISSKIYQTERASKLSNRLLFLEKIINEKKKGVILIDQDNKIISINNRGLYLLNLKPDIFSKKIKLNGEEKNLNNSTVFKLNINNILYNVTGQHIETSSLSFENNKILIFEEVYDVPPIPTKKIENLILIGESQSVKKLNKNIKKASTTDSSVLILGESGSNLEKIALSIHQLSRRKMKNFEIIQCGNHYHEGLNNEFYGKFDLDNSFGVRISKFKSAEGGTIFLNDIDKLPIAYQYELLKIINSSYRNDKQLNIKIIAGTSSDITELIKNNNFNSELYYRLNVMPFSTPSLRERREDIEVIINHLITKYSEIFETFIHTLEESAKLKLLEYSWPGNWQELESCIEFLVNLSIETGVISENMLPEYIKSRKNNSDFKKIKTISEIEKIEILKALNIFGNTLTGKKEAAEALGISVATLYRKIKFYNIKTKLKYELLN